MTQKVKLTRALFDAVLCAEGYPEDVRDYIWEGMPPEKNIAAESSEQIINLQLTSRNHKTKFMKQFPDSNWGEEQP